MGGRGEEDGHGWYGRQHNHQRRTRITILLDNDRPACLLQGLVTLEDIWISDIRDGFTDEVDDIAIAFSQTITDLRATSTMAAVAIPPAVHSGRGWVDMLVLDRLVLDIKTVWMVLDRELPVHCPNLRYVVLGDRTFDCRCQDIVPSLPARLCRLVTLTLYGWSSLPFTRTHFTRPRNFVLWK